jgi:hypothetical protein
MAKLENNSLRYGMNTQNNVSSIANNAYQQEMENQRNMQNQTTVRQKTLLEALDKAATEKAMIRDRIFVVDPKTGAGAYNPKDPNDIKRLDDEIARASRDAAYPYLYQEKMIRESIPTRQTVDIDGSLVTTMSDQGYSYMDALAARHPDIFSNAKSNGLNVGDYLQGSRPFTSLPIGGR